MSRNSPAGNAFAALFILFAFSLASAVLFCVAVAKGMPMNYTAISGAVAAASALLTYLAGKRYGRLQREQDEAEREWFNSLRH